MARASTHTLLSLDRYAKILGVNPVHFAGATAGEFFPLHNRCSDIWLQHGWMFADSVSREDLALAIRDAELDIANELGFWPAPTWTVQEIRQYPRHHRPDAYRYGGRNVRGQMLSVLAEYGKVIQAGQRAVTLVGTATAAGGELVYSDADGDGFTERATITLPTTLTDASRVKVFITGYGGAPIWEIRDPWYKEISGGNVEIRFYVWQMIRPELWEVYPTTATMDGPQAIDLTDLTNLVQSVEVYREYTPTNGVSATFYWEPTPSDSLIDGLCGLCGGTGCEACTLTTQNGCLHVRDANRGVVVPQPATYDEDTAAWSGDCFAKCRDPDFVKVWYYSGGFDQGFLAGHTLDPLPQVWANAIAWLATARLERPFCSCGNVLALCQKWQDNLAAVSSTQQQAQSYQNAPDVLSNPFGSRLGEVMAWRRVRRSKDRLPGGGVA